MRGRACPDVDPVKRPGERKHLGPPSPPSHAELIALDIAWKIVWPKESDPSSVTKNLRRPRFPEPPPLLGLAELDHIL